MGVCSQPVSVNQNVAEPKLLSYQHNCGFGSETLLINKNNEVYLYGYNNTVLQKRRKHDNYSNLVITVKHG